MISLHYTSHTKAYNTIYAACNIVEAIYSFTVTLSLPGCQLSVIVANRSIIVGYGQG